MSESEDRGCWLVDGVWYTHDDEGNTVELELQLKRERAQRMAAEEE